MRRPGRALLDLAELIDPRVVGAAQRLLADADRVVAGAVQKVASLARQVLVDLEPHAAPGSAISTIRSRARSAA
jgi:hypothetical protein